MFRGNEFCPPQLVHGHNRRNFVLLHEVRKCFKGVRIPPFQLSLERIERAENVRRKRICSFFPVNVVTEVPPTHDVEITGANMADFVGQ